MVDGTLREQVAYPVWETSLLEELNDDKMEQLFRECNLADVWQMRKNELDHPEINWGTVLSLGEQQRLQFCRLLWHQEWHSRHLPQENFFAVLDEVKNLIQQKTSKTYVFFMFFLFEIVFTRRRQPWMSNRRCLCISL